MAHRRANKKQRDAEKTALALVAVVISAGVSLVGLIVAAKRLVRHPTYGNAARALLAALNLAKDLE